MSAYAGALTAQLTYRATHVPHAQSSSEMLDSDDDVRVEFSDEMELERAC